MFCSENPNQVAALLPQRLTNFLYTCDYPELIAKHYLTSNLSLPQSKGRLEARIATAITQFRREHLGRGPSEVRTWILQDLVLVRLKGVLTPAEEKLARDAERHRLVNDVRRQLLEGSRSILDKMIVDLAAVQVVSLHSDISIRTGERIIVFTV